MDTRGSRRERHRLLLAYHEAGHAVVACVEGLRPRLASIVTDEEAGTLGHVEWRRHLRFKRNTVPTSDSRVRLEPRIMVAFAGAIAERKSPGSRQYYWIRANDDLRRADGLLTYLVSSDRQLQALQRFLWISTEDLIDLHWDAVERVADALVVRKTLTGAEITALVLGDLSR